MISRIQQFRKRFGNLFILIEDVQPRVEEGGFQKSQPVGMNNFGTSLGGRRMSKKKI